MPDLSRDHKVIIFDQRGTWRSPVRSNDFSTQRLAADAAALLDAVGAGPAIVLGHSNGGRVAQLLALDYRDKVRKIILASSGGTHGSRGVPLDMCLGLVEMGYEPICATTRRDSASPKNSSKKIPRVWSASSRFGSAIRRGSIFSFAT